MSGPGLLEGTVVDEWLFSMLDPDPPLRTILSVPAGETRVAARLAPPS